MMNNLTMEAHRRGNKTTAGRNRGVEVVITGRDVGAEVDRCVKCYVLAL